MATPKKATKKPRPHYPSDDKERDRSERPGVTVRMPAELRDRIDEARGGQERAAWIIEAVEQRLQRG